MLTYEDIKNIEGILSKVHRESRELSYDKIPWYAEEDGVYKETLRRYMALKGK